MEDKPCPVREDSKISRSSGDFYVGLKSVDNSPLLLALLFLDQNTSTFKVLYKDNVTCTEHFNQENLISSEIQQ